MRQVVTGNLLSAGLRWFGHANSSLSFGAVVGVDVILGLKIMVPSVQFRRDLSILQIVPPLTLVIMKVRA
jgi:hypothetical protein